MGYVSWLFYMSKSFKPFPQTYHDLIFRFRLYENIFQTLRFLWKVIFNRFLRWGLFLRQRSNCRITISFGQIWDPFRSHWEKLRQARIEIRNWKFWNFYIIILILTTNYFLTSVVLVRNKLDEISKKMKSILQTWTE